MVTPEPSIRIPTQAVPSNRQQQGESQSYQTVIRAACLRHSNSGNKKILGQVANPKNTPVQYAGLQLESTFQKTAHWRMKPYSSIVHQKNKPRWQQHTVHLNGRDREPLIQQHLQIFQQAQSNALGPRADPCTNWKRVSTYWYQCHSFGQTPGGDEHRLYILWRTEH